MKKTVFLALMFIIFFTSASFARMFEGVEMPETLKAGRYTLVLNGAGVKKMMDLKLYVAGLYLQAAETNPWAIIETDEPQAIRLEMLRGTGAKPMNRALYNGIRTSTGTKFDAIESRSKQFEKYLYDKFEKGDIYDFKYIPNTGLEVFKNGKKRGTIAGYDFKQAFFGIWLNDKAPADWKVKEAMLAGDINEEAVQSLSTIQEDGLLNLSCDVPMAKVKVNNAFIGTAPIQQFPLQPGIYQLRVLKDGYIPYIASVRVDPGRQVTINTSLTLMATTSGHLYVDTNPMDSKVRILNITLPYKRGIELAPGDYCLEVSAHGHNTKKQWITLDPGEDKYISIVLGSNPP